MPRRMARRRRKVITCIVEPIMCAFSALFLKPSVTPVPFHILLHVLFLIRQGLPGLNLGDVQARVQGGVRERHRGRLLQEGHHNSLLMGKVKMPSISHQGLQVRVQRRRAQVRRMRPKGQGRSVKLNLATFHVDRLRFHSCPMTTQGRCPSPASSPATGCTPAAPRVSTSTTGLWSWTSASTGPARPDASTACSRSSPRTVMHLIGYTSVL